MRTISSNHLDGLWTAVPTPWNSATSFDGGILAENCGRLATARVDGIYTTDADGEFYAIELDEFRSLVRCFAKAMETTKVNCAVGVSWFNTSGVIDRIRVSVDAGINNVHVAMPMFMPLAEGDVDRFFDDLAEAVPQARWIYYAHAQSRPTLRGADYARLAKRFPNHFVASKIAAVGDITELTDILTASTTLCHAVSDPTLAVACLLGARANCSYWVNVMPNWSRRYMDACAARRWDEAAAFHRKFRRWEIEHLSPLKQLGYRHGIIAKALGRLTGFLLDSGITRAPYYKVHDHIFESLKSAFDDYWRDEMSLELRP